MKYTLQKINIKSFVLVAFAVSAVLGVFLGAAVTLLALFNPGTQESGDAWAILSFPVLNGLLGSLISVIFAYTYNLVAKYLGGIQVECEESN